MKKILLGTTGLVAVALLATAASADTPKVTLGGFSDFQAGWTNDDQDANRRSQAFRNDNEITVKVDGKTAGGLGYGAEIDLEADTTADADNQGTNASRTFTYLEGNWGRAEMGDVNSAAGNMRVDASTLAAATGGINGAWTYFVNGTVDPDGYISTSKLVTEHGSVTGLGNESLYNSTKISYYSPKFSGFQAGVSYTPALSRGQGAGGADPLNRVDNTGGDVENIWDLGLGYEGTFSGVKLAAAATYEMGDAEDNTTEDTRAWNLGALVGYQGFSAAASYGDWDDSDNAAGLESNYWTAGLGYTAGAIGVSATYLNSEREVAANDTNEFDNIVLGAEYKLAAGLTPYAEVSFYDFDDGDNTANENQGTTVILGTQVAF